MTAPEQVVLAQAIVCQPAPTYRQVAHVAVEHRHGGWDVLDKQTQAFFAQAQEFLGLGMVLAQAEGVNSLRQILGQFGQQAYFGVGEGVGFA